jgi:branched-chain amino acid transport system permease protein
VDSDILLQQVINGLSVGAMYALLALGFTMVYGIIELINFAHFNVFMVGSFVALWTLRTMGVGPNDPLGGASLIGVLVVVFAVTMLATGAIGIAIERLALRPLRNVPGPVAMVTTIGVSYILLNVILLGVGADSKNYSNPVPGISWSVGNAVVRLREVLVWAVALLLMVALQLFVRRARMGKAMRATAQDQEAARMMGVDVDRVVAVTFFIGSALAGAAGLIFGLYYNYTSFIIGYSMGLRAFTAAVLGGIGNVPGAMLGGVLIGLIESLGGHFLSVRWADVIIFSILILILVVRPNGLLGRAAPSRS